MEWHRVEITRRMRTRAYRVGRARQDLYDKCGTPNAYGLKGDSDYWLKINQQGALAELVVATMIGTTDTWVECVEDYKSLKGDVVDHLQVRSTDKLNNGLILYPEDADEDCFVLVYVSPDHEYAVIRGWLWAHEGKKEQFWPGKQPERPCFMVSPHLLHQTPIPVWHGLVIRAKTNEQRVNRSRAKTKCARRKPDDEFRIICPKCGWAAKHLVMPYYDSPWRMYGGLCGECCYEACKQFDEHGWPDPFVDVEHVLLTENELEILAKRTFGLLPPKKPKRRNRNKVDPNQIDMGFGLVGASPGE